MERVSAIDTALPAQLPATSERSRGVLFALIAYGAWGVNPIYFKLVAYATPMEVLVHRVIWSLALLLVVVALRGSWQPLVAILRSPRHLAVLFVTGVLVAGNWLVFIWALQNSRMVEASLGYYINPLVTVLLGIAFLGERLRGALLVALVLATAGVVNEVIAFGGLPWISLALAITFGIYGLLRKSIGVDSVLGLTVETALLAPFAVAYGISLANGGALVFGNVDSSRSLGLMAAGVVTTIPLVAFGAATLRLPLWALGFLQYFAPSITLLLALFVYDEPFAPSRAITFALIWSALAIFSTAELVRARRQLA